MSSFTANVWVKIDNENYSIVEIPQNSSVIVLNEKKQLVDKVNLKVKLIAIYI